MQSGLLLITTALDSILHNAFLHLLPSAQSFDLHWCEAMAFERRSCLLGLTALLTWSAYVITWSCVLVRMLVMMQPN